MTVSRRLRFEILRRDGHTCRYCGAQAPDVPLTVDHVIPVTLGGGDEPMNLVTACQPCNAGKSSVPADAAIVADVEADALRWAKAMERAAWYRSIDRRVMDDLVAEFDAEWSRWHVTVDGERTDRPVPRDESWRNSIERFLSNGLPLEELKRLVPLAMDSTAIPDATWRYFCGCAWKAISELQEQARHLIEHSEEF